MSDGARIVHRAVPDFCLSGAKSSNQEEMK